MNITLILALVSIIAQNQYCLHEQGCDKYTCGDFTKDAVLILRANNISAYPVCNGIHYWIGIGNLTGYWIANETIQIEPQTNSLILSNTGIYARGRHCVARGVW